MTDVTSTKALVQRSDGTPMSVMLAVVRSEPGVWKVHVTPTDAHQPIMTLLLTDDERLDLIEKLGEAGDWLKFEDREATNR